MRKGKRIPAVLTACMMLCGMTAVMPELPERVRIAASAEETAEYTEGTYELLTYRNYGDHIEITGCDDSATEVVIPSEIDGVKVTTIGEYAFYSCYSLTSITIPEGVTSIGERALYGCTSLASITIPGSVASIGDSAFYGCASLTEAILSEGVTSVGRYAFWECPLLMIIEIPETLTDIAPQALHLNGWYEQQVSEDPLIIINNIVYDGQYCNGDVVIPDNVTAIGDMAFFENYDLTSVTFQGNSLTSIGESAFQGTGLSSIDLPEGLTDIGHHAFSLSTLSEVRIPESMTNIGELAFVTASDLSVVYLPNSVQAIDGSAFDFCYMLTDVYYNGTEEEWNAVSVETDWNGTILNNANIHFLGESVGKSTLGDLNLDGNVDAADASMILVAAANVGADLDSGLTEEQITAADLNGDGAFDSVDASIILGYATYVGAGGTLTIEEFLAQQ